jgi:hypothetical protein
MSDFLLQKNQNRHETYSDPRGMWFSGELKRWIVTSDVLIRDIMSSDAFAVPSYDVSAIALKLEIDLSAITTVRNYLPLAVEGSRHSYLREMFARHIVKNTRPAIEVLSDELANRLGRLEGLAAGEKFCLYDRVLRPTLRHTVAALAGMNIPPELDIELIPQMFDDTLSMSRRRTINAVLAELLHLRPETLTEPERIMPIAVITLSANTLLGSLALSVVERLLASPGTPLSKIDWGQDFARTSLPLVEKKATKDNMLGGHHIQAGDRLRLFIESPGMNPAGQHQYDELFFAAGPHKCVGMSFCRTAWGQLTKALSMLDRKIRIIRVDMRDRDHVFNFPTTIEAQIDD